MIKLFSMNGLLILLVGTVLSCQTSDSAEGSAGASDLKKATAADATAETMQYQAVCISKSEHEGNEYILTKWLDSKDKALVYGREHARKKKGHDVIYRERVKPKGVASQ